MKKIKLKGGKLSLLTDESWGEGRRRRRNKGSARPPLNKATLAPVIARLQIGATLRSQSIALGYKGDNELRAALREMLGEDGYKNILKSKRSEPPQARVRARDKKLPVLDGAKLKWRKSDATRVFAAKRMRAIKAQARDVSAATPFGKALAREYQEMRAIVKQPTVNRWHCKQVPAHEPRIRKVQTKDGSIDVADTGLPITVYVSPKGREYVRASPLEHADLIIAYPDGLRIRLARWQKSSQFRQSSKAIEAHERALAHHKRKTNA